MTGLQDDAALARSYARAEYRVQGERPFPLRVDETSSDLDAVLQRHGVREWALITADNPRSQRLSGDENLRREDDLRTCVRALGYAALPTVARDADGHWPHERGLLVLGIPLIEAIELGKRFDQNAILAGEQGRAVSLVWLRGPLVK